MWSILLCFQCVLCMEGYNAAAEIENAYPYQYLHYKKLNSCLILVISELLTVFKVSIRRLAYLKCPAAVTGECKVYITCIFVQCCKGRGQVLKEGTCGHHEEIWQPCHELLFYAILLCFLLVDPLLFYFRKTMYHFSNVFLCLHWPSFNYQKIMQHKGIFIMNNVPSSDFPQCFVLLLWLAVEFSILPLFRVLLWLIPGIVNKVGGATVGPQRHLYDSLEWLVSGSSHSPAQCCPGAPQGSQDTVSSDISFCKLTCNLDEMHILSKGLA